jgi:hypothetical protein
LSIRKPQQKPVNIEASIGLIYDTERQVLGVNVNGVHFFANGGCDFTPNEEHIIPLGDGLTILRRMVKTAGEQQAGKTRLVPYTDYADEHGLDHPSVNRFCETQHGYAVGVRRVKVGEGTMYYLPQTLDPRVIIATSPLLMRVNEEIKAHLARHPALSAGKIATQIRQPTARVRNELARMVKEGKAVCIGGRYTLI